MEADVTGYAERGISTKKNHTLKGSSSLFVLVVQTIDLEHARIDFDRRMRRVRSCLRPMRKPNEPHPRREYLLVAARPVWKQLHKSHDSDRQHIRRRIRHSFWLPRGQPDSFSLKLRHVPLLSNQHHLFRSAKLFQLHCGQCGFPRSNRDGASGWYWPIVSFTI